MKKYRDEIDVIDAEIAELLNKRLDIAKRIGQIKAEKNIKILDKNRENVVYHNVLALVDEDKKEYVKEIYKSIIRVSKAYQVKTIDKSNRKKILVINGPNLNMLGKREKEQYGTFTYDDLLHKIEDKAAHLGVDVEIFQSNSETDIIEKIQRIDGYDALIINPAAYTHTSIAILDALLCLDIFIVEVHISSIEEREDFRKISLSSKAANAFISGQGLDGYSNALELCANNS